MKEIMCKVNSPNRTKVNLRVNVKYDGHVTKK